MTLYWTFGVVMPKRVPVRSNTQSCNLWWWFYSNTQQIWDLRFKIIYKLNINDCIPLVFWPMVPCLSDFFFVPFYDFFFTIFSVLISCMLPAHCMSPMWIFFCLTTFTLIFFFLLLLLLLVSLLLLLVLLCGCCSWTEWKKFVSTTIFFPTQVVVVVVVCSLEHFFRFDFFPHLLLYIFFSDFFLRFLTPLLIFFYFHTYMYVVCVCLCGEEILLLTAPWL